MFLLIFILDLEIKKVIKDVIILIFDNCDILKDFVLYENIFLFFLDMVFLSCLGDFQVDWNFQENYFFKFLLDKNLDFLLMLICESIKCFIVLWINLVIEDVDFVI